MGDYLFSLGSWIIEFASQKVARESEISYECNVAIRKAWVDETLELNLKDHASQTVITRI